MSSTYKKDLKKRICLKNNEWNYLLFSFLIKTNFLNNIESYKFFINFNIINKKFFIQNHCLLTKNNISINRFTSLTRSNFKSLSAFGLINNIKKSTW